VGWNGAARNDIDASPGVREALRWLHGRQHATVLVHEVSPPRERGTTWSMVLARRPQ
jgi:hypothetical protein